ncbi:DUF1801 domain-containing protein [Sphingomonas sp. So64.6b]|uniref:DUF1801 domain-containing protein n=1 Tax=Sphingomonas sp. So64.6b TaxID=2997354 RepID=UPI00160443E3|nr:DUF1801 domain-containing protein [Sphingomonas sp. So64.6b]QNA85684.1 DUF1801 domain-containing protein [Sphingomonas sp. So64.6b]
MMMAENKTQETGASVETFLARVEPEQRRSDARIIIDLMTRISGEPATMWGPSIIGFGRYRYRYDSGREGEMARIGFSPRKASLVLYIAGGFPRHDALMAQLGNFTTGKSCLYVKKLSDVDMGALEALIVESLDYMRMTYPPA